MSHHIEQVQEAARAFLARHAQAEQQEAQEIGPLKGEFAEVAEQAFREQYGLEEAQGAQAGDEHQGKYWAFRNEDGELRITDRWDVAKHIPFDVITLVERAALATQPAVPVSAEAMSFEYAHISGERRTVSITREDVIEGMEDAIYEKLSDQICRCEPIGETNVVECNCQDYVEEFTLVSAKPAVRGAEHD